MKKKGINIDMENSMKIYHLVSSTIMIIVILYFADYYNHKYDIGVNRGTTFMFLLLFDMPIYSIIILIFSTLVCFLIKTLNWKRFIAVLLIQFILCFLIIDFHYWKHPSPLSEVSYSVIWKKILR